MKHLAGTATGLMSLAISSSRAFSDMLFVFGSTTSSVCCVDRTIVSMALGVRPSYNAVTWDLASGRSQPICNSLVFAAGHLYPYRVTRIKALRLA